MKEERALRRERDASSRVSEQAFVHRLFPDWEGPLERSGNQRPRPDLVAGVVDLWDKAMALVHKDCHLHTFKSLSATMMEYYTATFDSRLKLRPPTLDEVMAADEEISNGRRGILTLVNEAGWPLEQAIFDMLHRRNDVDRLLARKPVTPSNADNQSNARGSKRAWNSKGPGKGKGKWQDKGKGKGKWQGKGKWKDNGKSKGAKTKTKSWPANLAKKIKVDGTEHRICQRNHNGQGCTQRTCKFSHLCPVMLKDGTSCGRTHKAVKCDRPQETRKPPS